jgi:hypothetical protein
LDLQLPVQQKANRAMLLQGEWHGRRLAHALRGGSRTSSFTLLMSGNKTGIR